MKVKQISVFLENRAGRLAEICRLLGDAGVNIRALALADTSDFGILRLIVNDVTRAVEVLKKASDTVSLTDVIAVEVPDTPGGLADILETLSRAGMNVEYLYAFVEKKTDKAIVVFRFENLDGAVKVFQKSGISVLTAEQVYSL
ncbi:MAG: ACT domain-containing protein [Kiritimatiellae bacterium]|nr:ACT domain-containing protein [Kiritimatiellia bacterium]